MCMVFIFKVHCPMFVTPMNGDVLCTLMSGIMPSYDDTCNVTCSTGYELTGSDTRTCQSDGSWSGDDVMCRRGRQILYVIEYCYY